MEHRPAIAVCVCPLGLPGGGGGGGPQSETGCPRGPNGSMSSSDGPTPLCPMEAPPRCLRPKQDMSSACSWPAHEPLASKAIMRASRSSISPSRCSSVARSCCMVSFILDCAEVRCVRSCSNFFVRSARSFLQHVLLLVYLVLHQHQVLLLAGNVGRQILPLWSPAPGQHSETKPRIQPSDPNGSGRSPPAPFPLPGSQPPPLLLACPMQFPFPFPS